jgi:hypothetical protein
MLFLGLKGLEDKITAESSFRDRKTKSITLTSFSIDDLQKIVTQRIRWVGGRGISPFTENGLKRLCESASSVPRRLMENGQKVVEECAVRELLSIDENIVEEVIGTYAGEDVRLTPISEEGEIETPKVVESKSADYKSYDLMGELSPMQREIVNLLREKESLSITELSSMLNKDIRSIGSLIRKLRGLNPEEVGRKPNIQYPVVVRKGKENRAGRVQYVYSLSDNTRRLLAR